MCELCDIFCINKEATGDLRSKMLDLQLIADAAEGFKVLGVS
jgi:hypothetical protein